MLPREVELLKEIAELKQMESALTNEKKRLDIHKQIEKKQIEFSLLMERKAQRHKRDESVNETFTSPALTNPFTPAILFIVEY